jgi:toxin ParE1/3/4
MRLRWTPNAVEDLESIYAYLSKHRPIWAQSTIRLLYDAARSLRTMPDRGRAGKIAGTKELVLDRIPYLVIYQVTGQVVELIHIVHTSQETWMN